MIRQLLRTLCVTSLVIGSVFRSYAGDSFVYDPETMQEALRQPKGPGAAPDGGGALPEKAQDAAESGGASGTEPASAPSGTAALPAGNYKTVSGKPFSFGELSGQRFQNLWAGYAIDIPQGFEYDYGKPYYEEIFYVPQDAVYDVGSAIDLLLVTADTSGEQPDPEEAEDDALLFMSFFLKTEGGPFEAEANAFAENLIGRLTGNRGVAAFMTASKREIGGYDYLCLRFDYEEALQKLYRSLYGADGKEHPFYEETYSYGLQICFRQIDDKLLALFLMDSGKYYGKGDALLSGIRQVH